MNSKAFLIHLFLLIFLSGSIATYSQDNNFDISKNLDIYTTLLKELDKNYAEDINVTDLNEAAIEAMLKSLDPYTVFIPESRSEDYRMLTTGQYGGIGALIHKQGEYVVISEPYEGFPAQKSGLKAGDRILAINGESAVDKSSSDVSEILKGQPGFELVIEISRDDTEEHQTISIIREKIQIPNVPYYGLLEGNIGYISLINFTKNAGQEVRKAFMDLKENNELEGIIIDLRGNGGGLLNEAVNLVNVFVDKGELIVSTKGKMVTRNHDHHTRLNAADTEIPLAILVDAGSASASEIVAGAIQDLDRGVVIGGRTFGKGLVQNVLPLSYNSQVKITVAKYYIPSGRCIQAIDYFQKDENGNSSKVPDSLIREFETRNGRPVRDGGGIEPDIDIEKEYLSNICTTLISKWLVFDYANKFAREHESIAAPEEFEVTDEIYDDFMAFLQDKEYNYKTDSEEALEKLKKSAKEENYFDAIKEDYVALKDKMLHDKQEDLRKNEEEIKEVIKSEIVARYYYQKGRIQASLKDDHEINKAIEVLKGHSTYIAILEGDKDEN